MKSPLLKNILTVFITVFVVGNFLIAHAQSAGAGTNGTYTGQSAGAGTNSTNTPSSNTGTTQGVALNIHLNNPLSGVSTIPDAINKFLTVIIKVALPLIIIFFIWSGFSFILARGNPEGVKKAKNMFFYTVIGCLLILGAWVITNAIIGTVNAIIS